MGNGIRLFRVKNGIQMTEVGNAIIIIIFFKSMTGGICHIIWYLNSMYVVSPYYI